MMAVRFGCVRSVRRVAWVNAQTHPTVHVVDEGVYVALEVAERGNSSVVLGEFPAQKIRHGKRCALDSTPSEML